MRTLLLSFCILLQQFATAQSSAEPLIRTDKITIARDTYGVPHIFAPTDPEVAYGLAWAHAEDDFTTIQTLILTGKGKLATYLGAKGAPVDYVFGLLNTKSIVLEQINSLDPKFILLVKGYLAGLEAFAKAHPDKVLNKHVFPISIEDYLASTVFSVAVFTGGLAMQDMGKLHQLLGCVIGMIGIFLPGFLLLVFLFPVWQELRNYPFIKRGLAGINAATVGFILAASYIMFHQLQFDFTNFIFYIFNF